MMFDVFLNISANNINTNLMVNLTILFFLKENLIMYYIYII